MHARHRSPGSGVRSMGMGLAASRISPEGSVRGHGMYSMEYRHHNRSFGRGPPKPYPPTQPPRRGDIFMEAGRLAAEYLVSQGLLPPNVLLAKSQNGSLKNHIEDLHEFRSQDREGMQLPPEGRMSALARLGNVVPDAGSGRRRYSEEFNLTGSRNHARGKRRMGPFRGYVSDWSSGRSGPWSDKAKFLQDMEVEDDFVSGCHRDQRPSIEIASGTPKVVSSELNLKGDTACDSESELETNEFPDDTGSKASSSSTWKELPPETEGEISKWSDDSRVFSMETGEVKDGSSNDDIDKQGSDDIDKQGSDEDFTMHCSPIEGDPVRENGSDLLKLFSFTKVPTRTRSALAYKGSKVDPVPLGGKGNTSDIAIAKTHFIEGTLSATLTNHMDSSKGIDSDISGAPAVQFVEDTGDLNSECSMGRGKCRRSQSFPEESFTQHEQESGQGLSAFGRSSSMSKLSGEKRTGEHDDMREGTKKQREWPLSMVTEIDESFHLHNLSVKQQSSLHGESLSPDEEVVEAVGQESSVDVALFPKGGAESGIEFREEKQLFPSSFKICDLNLMEASDMNEGHDSDPILGLASTLEMKKEASVDVGLSISNTCNRSDDYDRCLSDTKEAATVDATNDSVKEGRSFSTAERNAHDACTPCLEDDASPFWSGTVYSSLENFPNHTESTGDLPDVQDGYGLMISELLGTDISNCSSVQTNISGLHTEMSLHNGEGILGDDDPIYLSLGEIPISMPDI
ncbi:uncharacterized protein At4g26450 isoform X2 [Macadamia integrifolia]|uniref:uncharacterized protein At4g26450 isoform X2 n=1 Tax=Macadamia integrifolia TaxID=60698 RepID=UPI001C4E928D|nr:uncharacterized protein At4g26450 isoform X2 [Macadamia integrifolia]